MTRARDLSNIAVIMLIFMPIIDKIRKFLDVTPRDSRDVLLKLAESKVTENSVNRKGKEKIPSKGTCLEQEEVQCTT